MNLFAVAKFSSRQMLAIVFAVLTIACLNGCGQTGPLYQPPAEDPEGTEEK